MRPISFAGKNKKIERKLHSKEEGFEEEANLQYSEQASIKPLVEHAKTLRPAISFSAQILLWRLKLYENIDNIC